MNAARSLMLASLTLLILVGVSGSTPVDDDAAANRGLWTVYTVANTSMASWHLTEIYEDARGRMWFASFENGASMYDDGALITYNESNSAVTDRTTSFVHHPDGSVWVGTIEGIVVFREGQWSRLEDHGTDGGGLDGVFVSALYRDAQDRVWIGTWGEGVRMLADGEWTSWRANDGLPDDHAWTFYQDQSGNVWVGTKEGIGVYDANGDWTVYTAENSPLAVNEVRVFLENGAGDLYIGTYGGGVNIVGADGEWRETQYTTQDGLASNFVTAFAVQAPGDDPVTQPELIWIGTEAGLVSFDGAVFSDPMPVINNKLSHHFIEDLHIDDDGVLWIVTYGGAVTQYKDETWEYLFPTETGLAADDVYALLEDTDGNIWVGTSLGLSKFDGRAWETFIPDNSDLVYRYVNGLAEDRHGRIWISTLSGGSVYSHGEWITYNRFGDADGEQRLPSNSLFNVYYDSQGRVWYATGLGAAVLEDGQWTLYSRNDGLNTNIISVVTEDARGRVWLTHWQGINILDNGVWNSLRTENADIRTDLVLASRVDSQGRMWFGTIGDGVAIYDGQRWTKHNRANGGLSDDNVRALVEDRATGRFWVGTDGGLNGLVNDQLWMVYTAESTPLPDNRVNELLLDRKGNLWVGTAAGVAVFHPGSDFPLLESAGAQYPWRGDGEGELVSTSGGQY